MKHGAEMPDCIGLVCLLCSSSHFSLLLFWPILPSFSLCLTSEAPLEALLSFQNHFSLLLLLLFGPRFDPGSCSSSPCLDNAGWGIALGLLCWFQFSSSEKFPVLIQPLAQGGWLESCLRTSSTGVSWELVRNADSRSSLQTCWIRSCLSAFKQESQGGSVYALKHEKHWVRSLVFKLILNSTSFSVKEELGDLPPNMSVAECHNGSFDWGTSTQ